MNLRRLTIVLNRNLTALPLAASAAICFACCFALWGWRFHTQCALPRLLGSRRLAPDTAVAFLLVAFTILLLYVPRARRAGQGCAFLFLFGGILLPWFIPENVPTAVARQAFEWFGVRQSGGFPHMARAAALGLSLWGLGLSLLLARPLSRFRRLGVCVCGTLLVSLGASCVLIFALGIHDQDQKTLSAWLFQMSGETAVFFCVLGLILALAASRYPDMRRPSNHSFFQTSTILIVSSTFLLLFISVNVSLSLGIAESTRKKAAVAASYQHAKAMEALVAGLREAESGERGYLLTGDERYLRAYENGIRRARQAVQHPAPFGASLKQLVESKILELQKAVRRKQSERRAVTPIPSDSGLVLMDQIEHDSSAVIASFYAGLAEQNGAYFRAILFVRRTIAASYSLAGCLLACAALFFYREIARRTAIEQRLRFQEAELATRVQQRTTQLGETEARYRALMDQSPLAVHVLDRDGNSQHVNAAFERMVGVPARQMRGYNIWNDPQPPAQGTLVVLQSAFAGQPAVTGSIRHEPALSSGTALSLGHVAPSWVEVIAYPVKNEAGEVQEVVLLCQDVTARETALLAVRESEAKFRQLADLMPQIVWTATPGGVIDYFNQRWYTFAEGAPGGAGNWEALVHPGDLPNLVETWAHSTRAAIPHQVEHRLWDQSHQEYRWHLARAVPVFNRQQQVKCWFGTTTDIQEQKLAEETLERKVRERTAELQQSNALLQAREEELRLSLAQRDVLFQEVHHRVKNNLQVISSLLRMQAQSLHDEPAASNALEESRRRVLSMALIHERLYSNASASSVDFAEYTQTLVRELVYSYSLPGGRIHPAIRVDRVELNVTQAIPCGLILNELVTNALKYAFDGKSSGEIEVVLRRTSGDGVELLVCDNGQGLPDGLDWRNSKSLGLPIVDILARQLEGSVEYTFQSGASFHVRFPLKND